ncbi:MAG: lysophospholipid acyltransferase family protein [Verrucomicrobiota bacterium]
MRSQYGDPQYYLVQTGLNWYLSVFHHLKVIGKEHIPTDRGCLIASNHDSFLDPPAVGCTVDPQPCYLARKTLFKPPIFDQLLPKLQAIPVDQENPDMVGLKKIIKATRDGYPVVIFPEGSRSWDGKLQPPMPGIGLVLAKTNAPVVPTRIFGAHDAWPRGHQPRPFKPVTVVMDKPFYPHSDASDKRTRYQEFGEEVMERIAQITNPLES